MTAMTSSADCPPARLAATRDGLHRVAEHILAAARYAASGRIGLIPSPGGFRTRRSGQTAGSSPWTEPSSSPAMRRTPGERP